MQNERSKMSDKVRIGFPLRRCSWFYAPIVSVVRTRAMIRWLDSVCVARTASRRESSPSGTTVKGGVAVRGA